MPSPKPPPLCGRRPRHPVSLTPAMESWVRGYVAAGMRADRRDRRRFLTCAAFVVATLGAAMFALPIALT